MINDRGTWEIEFSIRTTKYRPVYLPAARTPASKSQVFLLRKSTYKINFLMSRGIFQDFDIEVREKNRPHSILRLDVLIYFPRKKNRFPILISPRSINKPIQPRSPFIFADYAPTVMEFLWHRKKNQTVLLRLWRTGNRLYKYLRRREIKLRLFLLFEEQTFPRRKKSGLHNARLSFPITRLYIS